MMSFIVYFVHYEKPLEAFLSSLEATAARYLSPHFLVPRVSPKSPGEGCLKPRQGSHPSLQMCCLEVRLLVVGGPPLPCGASCCLDFPRTEPSAVLDGIASPRVLVR